MLLILMVSMSNINTERPYLWRDYPTFYDFKTLRSPVLNNALFASAGRHLESHHVLTLFNGPTAQSRRTELTW